MSHANSNRSKRCSLCLKHFNAISDKLHTSLKSASFTSLPASPISPIAPPQYANEFTATPLISINVIDPDNSNICMCNNAEQQQPLTVIEENDDDDPTCRICQNMIEKNVDDRRTMVTEKTMFGDVIVNRIDSQYHLSSTYANNLSDIKKMQDPYTPESVESHSPLPEMDGKYSPTSALDEAEVILHDESGAEEAHNHVDNINHSHHVVTPSQLTTRLEILRRESHFKIGEEGKEGGGSGENDADRDDCKSSKSCFRCCCTIA